jgi:hypothetical protein
MEKRIAQLATIPEREPILETMLLSIYDQMDEIHVQLNGFKKLPEFHSNFRNKITWHFNSNDNLADAEKFRGIENFKDCYFFTCDDDLVYPPDYAERMINRIEFYKRRVVVGYHGSIFCGHRPFTSYYYDRLFTWRCLEPKCMDDRVDIIGTGCMAFHTSTIKLNFIEHFKHPFMVDLLFSIQAKKQKIDLIVIEHNELEYLKPEIFGETIWDHQNSNDELQTEILNREWDN